MTGPEARIREYDAACRRILSGKDVLAIILRGAVREFRGLAYEEIMPCI